MHIDPRDPQAVAPALGAFIAKHLGVPAVRFAEPPAEIPYGWDTHTYFFRLEPGDAPPLPAGWTRPLVLRLYADADQAARARNDVAIQRFVVGRGFPAAPPLAIVDASESPLGLPFFIMERLSGEPMLHRITRNPLRAWGYFSRMAALHAELHRLDPAGWPLPQDGSLADRTLAMLRADAECYGFHELDRHIAWLEDHKGTVIPEERSICHGDYHPLNILVDDGGRFSVVNWGGAATGDRHADVANTMIELTLVPTTSLSLVQRAIAAVARRMSARRYLARYRAHLPVDPARLRYWEALLALRWALQFSLVVRDGSAAYGLKAETAGYVRQSHVDAFVRHFEKLTRA